jgi:thiol-disulfide isomerase/thioredoxin
MRAPVDHITAPPFPRGLTWINSAPLRLDQLLGRAVLVEFWDYCRANSIRTLPYVQAWHERYEDHGLRVIGVHSSGFELSQDPEPVRKAVARLGIPYPVVVDSEHEIWRLYGNMGWPARYLFDRQLTLIHYHYGEGNYDETEQVIQELCGVNRSPLKPIRPEDVPGAVLEAQTEDVAGPYSGPYRAGGVWAVLDGSGTVSASGRAIRVDGPGCYELISHERSTEGELELEIPEGVRCYAVCFTPGLA